MVSVAKAIVHLWGPAGTERFKGGGALLFDVGQYDHELLIVKFVVQRRPPEFGLIHLQCRRIIAGVLAVTTLGQQRSRGGETATSSVRDVVIPPIGLAGILRVPDDARALIVFAHGSGSSRLSPRNTKVAEGLNDHGLATLLFDLLTEREEEDRANVFNIGLLATRLADAIEWLGREPAAARFPIGLFGASTGAAAALIAAARLGGRIGAVVSRGGRPDLAGDVLDQICVPTLLIVGGIDVGVIELNERAFARLQGPRALEIVPGASHLFPEPGALDAVINHAARWFTRYLARPADESGHAARR
jgi:putative phosphoribosyl transferase